MIGYDIATHSTVLWLEQYDKATYRVRYNNTPGSFGYQRVVRYNAARSTTTITFLSSIPLHSRQTIVRRQSGIHVSTKRQETKNILQTIRIHLSVKPFLGKQIKKALFQLVNTCTLLYYLLETRQNVFFPR